MAELFFRKNKMKEWPFNREQYVRNPQLWIKHYMDLFEYQKAQRMKNPLWRAKLAIYNLKKKIKNGFSRTN